MNVTAWSLTVDDDDRSFEPITTKVFGTEAEAWAQLRKEYPDSEGAELLDYLTDCGVGFWIDSHTFTLALRPPEDKNDTENNLYGLDDPR